MPPGFFRQGARGTERQLPRHALGREGGPKMPLTIFFEIYIFGQIVGRNDILGNNLTFLRSVSVNWGYEFYLATFIQYKIMNTAGHACFVCEKTLTGMTFATRMRLPVTLIHAELVKIARLCYHHWHLADLRWCECMQKNAGYQVGKVLQNRFAQKNAVIADFVVYELY
jgi:hypothetical protein